MSTFGTAVWSGGIKDGKGAISTKSGALKDYPYGFAARFEGGQNGTNPEELIGTAHAGCFTMALSNILGQAGLTAEKMDAVNAFGAKPVVAPAPFKGAKLSGDKLTLDIPSKSVVVVAVVEGTWVVVMVDEVVAVEEEDVVAAADEMAVEAVAVAGQLSMQRRTGVSLPSQAKR